MLSFVALSVVVAAAVATPQYGGRNYYGYVASPQVYDNSNQWLVQYFPDYSPDEREVFPEWFDVDSAKDCDKVPDAVNTGRPRDLCAKSDAGTRFCICLKRPRGYAGLNTAASGYEPVCGECRDPCALRFVPDTYRRDSEDADNKKTDKKKNDDDDDN